MMKNRPREARPQSMTVVQVAGGVGEEWQSDSDANLRAMVHT